jgi:polygalacturonase
LPGDGTRSAKDFGAAGDGKADDTAAIQRAIDECREVFFPAGTYVVSDTLRLRPDTGRANRDRCSTWWAGGIWRY